MALLHAPNNINPTPTSTVANLSIIEGSVLETSQGPGGTAKEIHDKQGSDTISVYTVHPGDTLSQIAFMFDVSPNTILWANDLKSQKDIHPGDQLIILPISGLKYTIKKGDTLKGIAKATGGDVNDIISYNDLSDDYVPKAGEILIIPDGETTVAVTSKPSVSSSKPSSGSKGGSLSGYFIKPTAGVKTQGLHGKYRTAVDLAAPIGTAVKAAAGGTVIIAKMGGYNGGYGNYIVIQHANGVQSLYGHLSAITTSVGAHVGQGELIGKVGNSGNSTGSHLHFELWGGVRNWNPFN
jgi:murein DD-endopeptidase MepM/ murein hydrolase activator NlpD